MNNQHECTQERFLEDVKDHQIDIVKDDGVFRSIRFRRANGRNYWFDLITWPGHLCIAGDCGTYVFSRLPDMFEFFRMDDGDFNKRKDILLSIGTNAGYEKFSEESFKERVKEHFDNYMGEDLDDDEKDELWAAIEEDILHCVSNEYEAYIWCLYAIVWGIMEYDKVKQAGTALNTKE